MDVEAASAGIDALIERRAGERNAEGAEEMAWKASARKHDERVRRENRAAWYGFYSRLAESHALISREYERRAEALCGEAAEG